MCITCCHDTYKPFGEIQMPARNSYLKNTAGGDFVEQKFGGTLLTASQETSTIKPLQTKDSAVSRPESTLRESSDTKKLIESGNFARLNKLILFGTLDEIAGISSSVLNRLGGAGEGIGDRNSRETIRTQEGLEFTAYTDNSNQIALNLGESDGAFDVIVDWGDGSKSNINVWNDSTATHTYTVGGLKTIKVTASAREIVNHQGIRTPKTTGLLGQQMYFDNTVENVNTMRGWGGTSLRFWGRVTVNTGATFVYADYNNDLNNVKAALAEYLRDKPVGKYLGDYMANIEDWDVSSVTDFSLMTYSANLQATLDFGGGSSMLYGFSFPNVFNRNISKWDTSSATNFSSMFQSCSKFNQPIGDWDVSNVTSFNSMFFQLPFNQPIGKWDISSATNISQMFDGTTAFNQDLGEWGNKLPSQITGMFKNANAFNNGGSDSINNWNISSVSRTAVMFEQAYAFNQPVGNWDMSNVETIYAMFKDATSFNQDIGSWDLSGLTYISGQSNPTWRVFRGATSFNNGGSDSIKNWRFPPSAAVDLGQGIMLASFFKGATSFNQPIGEWDVSGVGWFGSMFDGATSFDQDISSWDFSFAIQRNDTVNFYEFMKGCNLSPSNYDALLIKWQSQSQPSRPKIGVDMGTSTYTAGGAAEAARTALVNAGWVITDGGAA